MNEYQNLKFGDLVKVKKELLIISDEKLKELKETYGLCLSQKQMDEIYNKAYYNDLPELLEIENSDLVVKGTRTDTYVIIQKILFGYRGSRYSEHSKYENFFNGYDQIQIVKNTPNIIIDTCGKDFDSYSIWTEASIIEVIQDKSLLNCEFFSRLI